MELKTGAAWFIIIVMIASTMGFVLNFADSGSNVIRFNGYKFSQINTGQWRASIDGQDMLFYSAPDQVASIAVPPEARALLMAARMFAITYNPHAQDAEYLARAQYDIEHTLALIEGDKIFVVRGLVDPGNFSLPQISCANATATVPVLLFEPANKTEILLDGSCVIARTASSIATQSLTDRILFMFLGVIDA